MRANLTFLFSKIAPIFSKTAPRKDQNGSVVFYFGPSRELKWPYTRRAEAPIRGHRLIGAVLTPKKDLFCGQRFGTNFGVVSALLNLQCAFVLQGPYSLYFQPVYLILSSLTINTVYTVIFHDKQLTSHREFRSTRNLIS